MYMHVYHLLKYSWLTEGWNYLAAPSSASPALGALFKPLEEGRLAGCSTLTQPQKLLGRAFTLAEPQPKDFYKPKTAHRSLCKANRKASKLKGLHPVALQCGVAQK